MGIVGGLLIGWILSLFGFKAVVFAGMLQLFGLKITSLGYYFIFALLGLVITLLEKLRPRKEVNVTIDDFFKKKK